MADTPRTAEMISAQFLARSMRTAAGRLMASAADLARYADQVEANAADPGRTGQFEHVRYGMLAQNAIHEVITTVFNANLGGLATAASEADLAHHTDTSGEKS